MRALDDASVVDHPTPARAATGQLRDPTISTHPVGGRLAADRRARHLPHPRLDRNRPARVPRAPNRVNIIADQLGLPLHRIRTALQTAGIPVHKPGWTDGQPHSHHSQKVHSSQGSWVSC